METSLLSKLAAHCHCAAEAGASDVFFNESEIPRIRIDGTVRMMNDLPPVARESLRELWQACEGTTNRGAPFSEDLDAHWETGRWRFRVNLHRHLGRWGASLRVIHTEIPTLESLRLPATLLDQWSRRAHGLILITGPTGCGKSTTVAAMLERMNHWLEGHIVTLEEPIEYLFTSRTSFFTQREIPEDVPDYASGLRSTLRQSPDVIFMGEIRDFGSARSAIQAAETGHLVLSTMHTSTVVETMERLAHLMPPEERLAALSLLSGQLVGVLTQKLLPRADGEGRQVVTEFFQNEGATRDWIQEMAYTRLAEFISSGQSNQCQSFRASLLEAWREGAVTRETVLKTAAHPQEMERLMRGVS